MADEDVLDAYSRVVAGVARELTPRVASLRVPRGGDRGGGGPRGRGAHRGGCRGGGVDARGRRVADVDDAERRAVWSAVVGIIIAVDVPIIYLSVRWWRSLHQVQSSPATVDPAMVHALRWNFVAFFVVMARTWEPCFGGSGHPGHAAVSRTAVGPTPSWWSATPTATSCSSRIRPTTRTSRPSLVLRRRDRGQPVAQLARAAVASPRGPSRATDGG